jgi:D-glycero-D-manno-heptose 1,7-bisphosphate phosphatase
VNKAVFLDRDGVINPLVYNIATGEYESPLYPEDFSVYPYVIKALQGIKELGFVTIIVSNQPSCAKGKTSMENTKAIEKLLSDFADENGHLIDAYYYCYHHPNGIVPELTGACRCRKPGTSFLEQAIECYKIDIKRSWFIGDQDSDIQCGNTMGIKTIKINNKQSATKSGKEQPFVTAANLLEAVKIIYNPNGGY